MASRFETFVREAKFPPFITRYFANSLHPDQMPQSRLRRYQEEAVREVISRAYDNSSFYRRKMTEAGVSPADIESLADIDKIPFTTKEELRQDPWALLACDKKDISLIHVSTGTTGGKEIYTMYTLKEYYLNNSLVYPKLVPVKRRDVCLIALPYEMSAAGLSYHNRFLLGNQAAVVAVGKGGAYSTPEKTVRMMRNLKPTILATSPSYSMTLAEAAEEASFDLKSLGLKKMWVGGEGCSPAFRKRVEKIWGTTVNFSCGTTESGTIGKECDAHNGYHIAQAHVLVEIVDPTTGKVLRPGEIGEIVLTCLLRFDTPLIRYRTQDIGYIDTKPCRCGVTLPRLYMRGRSVDQIMLKGKSYSPFYLEEFLMQIPQVGNWYQFIVQPGNNEELKIRTEPAAGLEPTPELARKLAAQMEAATGIPCQVELVSKLPRPTKKAVRVVRE
jgi:phenylacetate-CoA ligase